MLVKKTYLHRELQIFLLIALILFFIGFVFIYSASAVYASEMFGNSLYFVKKQITGLCIGIAAFICTYYFPLSLLKQTTHLLLMSSLALTALTLHSRFAVHINGSSRWINFFGLVFQPSELLKIAFIIYLGAFFSQKYITFISWQSLPFVFLCTLTSTVLLLQPDFGLTMTLLCTTALLFFVVQPKVRYVVCSGLIIATSGLLLIITQPYRLQRVMTFLDPWQDPKGKGFQIIQSFIAIGSGGWFGVGIGHSKQKLFYLPMQHTDFIFSIIAEETGFVGCCAIMSLFIVFVYFGIRLAQHMKDPFCGFTTLGFIFLLSLQSIINIAVATGLVPTKGIGLPFISYGNSGLVCTCIMLGLIANMSRTTQ